MPKAQIESFWDALWLGIRLSQKFKPSKPPKPPKQAPRGGFTLPLPPPGRSYSLGFWTGWNAQGFLGKQNMSGK